MFSTEEKRKISGEIEKLILSFHHPEMPEEKPYFKIHIDGKESWSWADIEPNWKYNENPGKINPWNEIAHEVARSVKKKNNEPNLEIQPLDLQYAKDKA